jgi:hypothetical protein
LFFGRDPTFLPPSSLSCRNKHPDMEGFKQILLFSGLCLYACHKELGTNTQPNMPAQALTLSATTVKKGQPLVASVPAGLTTNGVSWSVRPTTGTQVTSGGQSATISFSDAGTYTIVASYIVDSAAGTRDSATAPVTVTDSTYTAPVDSTTLVSESLILVPRSVDSGSVTFLIETVDAYACDLRFNMSQGASPYSDSVMINYLQPGGACPAGNSSNVSMIVDSFSVSRLNVGGSQTISVFLPGWEGQFQFTETATSTGYTFSPATELGGLITISPTQIQN